MEAAVKKFLMMRSTVYKDIQADVLGSLASLGETFQLDAKAIASSFDKFMAVSRQDSTGVTLEDVDAFRKEQQLAKAKTSNIFARQGWEDVDHQDALKSANKPRQRISPYLSKVVASVPEPVPMDIPAGDGTFKERCSKGAVQSVLNEDIPAKGATQAHAAGAIEVLGQPVEAHSRFMVDRLDDKAAYINHRISTFECEVENICGAGSAHPVGTAAQQPTFIVGRVCCDTEGEHLNAQSVILEGSVTVSHGARVPLDLSACPEFRLFPGQVAVVKGTNPSGFRIAASEVLTSLPLLVQQPMEDDSAQDGTSFIIAAGPYTATDNLAYEPLAALLEHCVEAQPDVLMLAGPFLDADHQILRDGALEHTFEEVFASRVVAQLTQFCDKVGGKTRVVLLPSPKDAHHEPVFPQGPMEFAAGSDITNLPNPCTFKYQGVVLGCSTVDWLMAAVREEIYQSAKQGERLPLLVMHQANQRSYYPMFPPAQGVPLDTTRGYALELPCTPHIIVAPSNLAPFAKAMPLEQATLGQESDTAVTEEPSSVICINPGRLTKGANPGTFVQMSVAPQAGPVDRRCRVEIRKL